MERIMQPSGKKLDEICDCSRERFFKRNGYYPTEDDIIRLIKEARTAIKQQGATDNK